MKKLFLIIGILFFTFQQNSKAQEEYNGRERVDLDRALYLVETAPRAFIQLGELSAERQLREADSILYDYQNDRSIQNARYDILDSLRMLEDSSLSYREKGRRLQLFVSRIAQYIRTSSYYRIPPPQRFFVVRCDSLKDFPRICDLGRTQARSAQLIRQHSNSACVEGYSWGLDYNRNQIWVSRGCRASFRVFVR